MVSLTLRRAALLAAAAATLSAAAPQPQPQPQAQALYSSAYIGQQAAQTELYAAAASLATATPDAPVSAETDDAAAEAVQQPAVPPKQEAALPSLPRAQILAASSSSGLGSNNLRSSWKPPLSTRGRYVVDANGKRFRFQGGNWHGASGTYNGNGDINVPSNHHAGELAYQTPLALDRVPIARIVQDFLDLGINTIRLPFSNEMLHTTAAVPDAALGANPELKGKTPLQIYDVVVEALTKAGIAVILNNHTVKSLWCCGLDQNARWNIAQSEQQWQDDWVFLVKRYKDNARVVGADLYNEVRRDLTTDPNWGEGGAGDWYQSSLDCAARIQREASDQVLILIEGINWRGIPIQALPHWRPELSDAATLSHPLPINDKLVYHAHFYAYTGANNTGASSGPFVLTDPLYRDLSVSLLNQTMDRLAGYVALNHEPSKHYTAPVWISEFGSAGRYDTLTADRNWWHNFLAWMIGADVDYAVWPLVGWQENAQGDLWALTAYDSKGGPLSIADNNGQADWRWADWKRLTEAGQYLKTGAVDQLPTFRMLSATNKNAIMSNRVFADTASYPGDRKAVCPDGLRLLGLTTGNNPRGLCTDATFGRQIWDAANGPWQFVSDERHVTQDWAPGYTKLTCPPNQHLIGYAYTGRASTGAYCAQFSKDWLKKNPISSTRAVFFNTANNYPTDHGRFTAGGNTGACNDDEIAQGYAFTFNQNGGSPAALLCASLKSAPKTVVTAVANGAEQLKVKDPGLVQADPQGISPWSLQGLRTTGAAALSFAAHGQSSSKH